MREQPASVVLVHGGFLGPWSWWDVATALEERGIATVMPALPSMGDPRSASLGDFYADADQVRRALDATSPPVLLCGHSYGGAVITQAAAGPHPAVAHLVYLAAAVPDLGQGMASFAPAAPAGVPAGGGGAPPGEGPVPGPGGSIVLPPDQAAAGLFHDCSPERARAGTAQLQAMNPAVGVQPVTGAAWRELPATFVRCTQDRMPELVTPAFFDSGPEIIELAAGHCPNWSQPAAVADLLAARAENLTRN